ncbi:peptidase S24 [Methylophaga nitratireducenticrescens]|nr:peptidase S24 [Methylophaga nitratireducenticrescens]
MESNEYIAARLKQERIRLGRTQEEFAELAEVTRQTQSKYEKGERTPDAIYLFNLSQYGLDTQYVITGMRADFYLYKDGNHIASIEVKPNSGSMLGQTEKRSRKDIKEEKTGSYENMDPKSETCTLDPSSVPKHGSEEYSDWGDFGQEHEMESFVRIPLYETTASAGQGSFIQDENITDSLIFKKEWIHNELHNSPGNLYLINIEGESMEPSLRPGDVVLVDHSDNTARRDGIYILRMGDALLVKRLQRLPGDIIKASSDNPAYQAFTIDLKKDSHEISIIGRVVWSGRRQ